MTRAVPRSATTDLVRSLLRHWWLFVLALAPAAVLLVVTPPPSSTYVGSTTVAIQPPSDATVKERRQFTTYVRRHIDTFAGLATTVSVLNQVITEQNLATTPRELGRQIEIVQPDNREFVSVEVTEHGHDEALRIAESLGVSLSRQIEDLSPRTLDGRTLVHASPHGVSVSRAPAERSLLLPGLLALLGLGGAATWVLLRFATDDVLRTPHDLETITHAPVITSLGTADPEDHGAHLLRLHLSAGHATARGVAHLIGTTPSAEEAFTVRDRLLHSFGSTEGSPPHIDVIAPARLATAPEVLVVITLGRTTGAELIRILQSIEQHGGSVAGLVVLLPRRPIVDRLRRARRRTS